MTEKRELPADDNKTPEQPQESVQDLRTIREAQGLSPEDIFKATRVSMINIMAVENEDFDRLPPPVYARNFIRKYAKAVGIDEKPLLNRYEKHLERLNPPREETEIRKPWPENGRRYRFLFLSLAAVIFAGVLVYAFFLYDQSSQRSQAPPAQESPQAQVEPAAPVQTAPAGTAEAPPTVQPQTAAAPATPSEVPGKPATVVTPTVPQGGQAAPAPAAAPAGTAGSPVPATTTAQPVAAPGKDYQLIIETHELTWVRITADRNPSSQALLKPGDRIERTAKEQFLLDIGNAGGINLIFQGKSLGTLGKQGQTLHLRLSEKGVERQGPY
jgi:cytoskeleton protein RodZ